MFIVKQLDKLLALYEKQMVDIGKAIEKLLRDDQVLKASVDRLCAVKGLGLLSVATLVAETNGFTGFDNVRQLVSFAAGPPGGYDVVENQSGQRVGKTRISKKGNTGPPERPNKAYSLHARSKRGSVWRTKLCRSLRTCL